MIVGPKRTGLEEDLAEQVARQLEVLLVHGNWDACHRVIDQMTDFAADVATYRGGVLERPLATIGLPTRILNRLEGIGLITVGDLRGIEMHELLAVPNLGPAAVNELRAKLKEVMV